MPKKLREITQEIHTILDRKIDQIIEREAHSFSAEVGENAGENLLNILRYHLNPGCFSRMNHYPVEPRESDVIERAREILPSIIEEIEAMQTRRTNLIYQVKFLYYDNAQSNATDREFIRLAENPEADIIIFGMAVESGSDI